MSFVKKIAGSLTGQTARKNITQAGRQMGTAQIKYGLQHADAARQALGTQVGGVEEAQDIISGAQPGVYSTMERGIGALSPYSQAGQDVLGGLTSAVTSGPLTQQQLMQTPGVQFRLAEAQKALERGASARGNILSGGHGRDLGRYMQELASTEYGNAENQRMNRIQAMQGAANMGLSAAGREAGMIQNLAGEQGRFANTQAGLAQELAGAKAAQQLTPEEIRIQAELARMSSRTGGQIQGNQAQQQAVGGLLGGVGQVAGAALGGPLGHTLARKMQQSSVG